MLSQLKSQEKDYNNIYNELENIKYRDISSYIIDFFICILNDKDYDIALSSTYRTAVDYIENEISSNNYKNYRDMLLKEGIIISDLFNVLLDHKLEFNSVTHGSYKELKEFIKLIKEFKTEKIGQKFELLFDKTPLLKNFCFVKRNGITRSQIKRALLTF